MVAGPFKARNRGAQAHSSRVATIDGGQRGRPRYATGEYRDVPTAATVQASLRDANHAGETEIRGLKPTATIRAPLRGEGQSIG
jgi:hypothetical protein